MPDASGRPWSAGARPGDHAILVRGNRDADPYPARPQPGWARLAVLRLGGPVCPARGAAASQLPARGQRSRGLGEPVRRRDLRTVRLARGRGDRGPQSRQPPPRPARGGSARRCGGRPGRRPVTGARSNAERLLESLDLHRRLAAEHSGGEVLYRFVTGSGWLARLAFQAREGGPERLENVARFFDILHHQGSVLRDSRLPFLVGQLETLLAAGDDPSTADADPDGGEAVHVLTYHKAKGLEFPTVFMVGLVEGRFPSRGRKDRLALPEEFGDAAGPGDTHIAEERRLFYVGMTRAKSRLILSWARDDGRQRRRLSQFVGEALDLPPATTAEVLRPSEVERIERLRPPAVAPATACPSSPRPGPGADAVLRPGERLPRLPDPLLVRARDPDSDPASATRWSSAARCMPRSSSPIGRRWRVGPSTLPSSTPSWTATGSRRAS